MTGGSVLRLWQQCINILKYQCCVDVTFHHVRVEGLNISFHCTAPMPTTWVRPSAGKERFCESFVTLRRGDSLFRCRADRKRGIVWRQTQRKTTILRGWIMCFHVERGTTDQRLFGSCLVWFDSGQHRGNCDILFSLKPLFLLLLKDISMFRLILCLPVPAWPHSAHRRYRSRVTSTWPETNTKEKERRGAIIVNGWEAGEVEKGRVSAFLSWRWPVEDVVGCLSGAIVRSAGWMLQTVWLLMVSEGALSETPSVCFSVAQSL